MGIEAAKNKTVFRQSHCRPGYLFRFGAIPIDRPKAGCQLHDLFGHGDLKRNWRNPRIADDVIDEVRARGACKTEKRRLYRRGAVFQDSWTPTLSGAIEID